MKHQGLSLIELVVVVGVLGLIVAPVSLLVKDAILSTTYFNEQLVDIKEAQRTIEQFTAELRTAKISSVGSFPIETAQGGSITFYANVDQDSLVERIRYFVDGSSLKRGLVKPAGNPLAYNMSSETFKTMAQGLVNSSKIFSYFDKNYTGNQASLTDPISPTQVRLVAISLTIDPTPNRPPGPVAIASQVTIRNLKDNL